MHWIRLKKLVCLPPFFLNLDGWRPQSGTCRSETLFFDQLQDFHFLFIVLLWFISDFIGLFNMDY